MTNKKTRDGEEQYGEVIEAIRRRGLERLGYMTSWAWFDDPRRLTFTLARYKFVAKMLDGSDSVLEIGCGDGFGTRVVRQAVRSLVAIDFDSELLDSARSVASDKFPIDFRQHDMLSAPTNQQFSACYCLDVLEHILPADEDRFLSNVCGSLVSSGICIVGTPSLESQSYASKYSKLGHVNCKSQRDLGDLMRNYFHNVFMFSMNDEVVHTGYGAMSHYNIALCCAPRSSAQ